jgi:hypothetical protein
LREEESKSMAEPEQKHVPPEQAESDQGHIPPDQHDRPLYHIDPMVRRFIFLALVLSIPSWFLGVLFNANTLVTLFTIFFTVLSAATGLFQLFPAPKGKTTNNPKFTESIILIVRKTTHKLTPPTRHLIYHARWGSFGLALAAVLAFGIWNFFVGLYYQLDIGITLLSVLLFLLGSVSTLYFLPPIQQWLLRAKSSKLSLIKMGRWPLALLLLMLALSGFWNIGLYRIADVCNGAQTADPPNGIGAVIRARECVGLSEGTVIFDAARPDGALKLEAANQLRHGGSRAKVISLFDEAITTDPTDAEALIYRQDLWVGAAQHMTIVAAADLYMILPSR